MLIHNIILLIIFTIDTIGIKRILLTRKGMIEEGQEAFWEYLRTLV